MLKILKYICLSVMVLLSANTFAQKEIKYARQGNKLYEKNNFKDAEINYRKSIHENKTFHPAYYNLANTMYNMGKFADADSLYNLFNNNIQDENLKAYAYHNIGNSLFQQQKYEESIEAYKKALRIRPKDADTKYNLAKAQQMLQQQQQQQQNQENKDQQNKDNKDQQNQKNQQNKDKEDNKQQNNQNKKQISKEEAERMLKALDNNDKKTQEKVKEQNQRSQNSNNIEKDW